jgi:hypothetical protein
MTNEATVGLALWRPNRGCTLEKSYLWHSPRFLTGVGYVQAE